MGDTAEKTSASEESLKKTPLADIHQASGAKMVPFAGWLMPVQYEGVIPEHQAVRTSVGIFDVSHMGEVTVSGVEAERFLQKTTCNDVARLTPGKAQYSAVLNEDGGVIDDIIVYCRALHDYLLCVNASNTDTVFSWLREHAQGEFSGLSIKNSSNSFGQLAIQGPGTCDLFKSDPELTVAADLEYFHFCQITWRGVEVLIARTGYTGEDGFEIFLPWHETAKLWSYFTEQLGAIPCGLGARDTLRLEAGYPLHGHELSPEVSALTSGLGWIIKFSKGDFIGSQALREEKELGVSEELTGFIINVPGIAREGDVVCTSDGAEIGRVTSGTKTPTVGKALGIARIRKDGRPATSEILIKVRNRNLNAVLAKLPFYTNLKRAKV